MYNLMPAAGKQAAAKQAFVLRGGINEQMSDEDGQWARKRGSHSTAQTKKKERVLYDRSKELQILVLHRVSGLIWG